MAILIIHLLFQSIPFYFNQRIGRIYHIFQRFSLTCFPGGKRPLFNKFRRGKLNPFVCSSKTQFQWNSPSQDVNNFIKLWKLKSFRFRHVLLRIRYIIFVLECKLCLFDCIFVVWLVLFIGLFICKCTVYLIY